MLRSKKWLILILLCITSCAALVSLNLDKQYGNASVANRLDRPLAANEQVLNAHYQQHIKPLLDSRCIVCHACYDAPCQLKMTSPHGFERGAHKENVYDGGRLLAATPNRLYIDATSIAEWRSRGFFPVLNERQQTPEANLQASLTARMLTLKQQHPNPSDAELKAHFDFSLNRKQQCPTIEEFDSYAQSQPYAGMPFGLPALNAQEHKLLIDWLAQGGYLPPDPILSAAQQTEVAALEAWLNSDDLKTQLSARYIYEHLFTSNLYFSAITPANTQPQFFRLVRSTTAPGQAVNVIASRRPFDDPGVNRVYYRLQPIHDTLVHKTHQPYDINQTLLQKWQSWFKDADYYVSQLPSYAPEVAANPLTAFVELPVNARYRFMLERAENTIMGYIKGPVCRGQVALNVINDRFWVYFVKPELAESSAVAAFYLSQQDNLRLPAEKESSTLALSWVGFAARQGNYLRARSDFMNQALKDGVHLTPEGLWDGDGDNQNASLTVFRHFDNATVVKGLIGEPPKTAWVIDYVLLERIHYLLVAGFDVYGNYGHQLMTRLYMDFLRMEGESNFLAFLPAELRRSEFKSWYQKSGPQLTKFIEGDINPFHQPSGIKFVSNDPKAELYQLFAEHLHAVQPARYQLHDSKLAKNSNALLAELGKLRGKPASLLPELTMIMVNSTDTNTPHLFTLIRNSAHYNVSSLFNESSNRNPDADDTTLVSGLLGSYPDAFWRIPEGELPKLVAQVQQLQTEADYTKLLQQYAIRRSSAEFWAFSDELNRLFMQQYPVEGSWLDYNRLENR
ncbi:fatty acid cis/trans isomerase [Alishewanella longhuensis]